MLVFIDESGDAGFAVADGASPVFVMAMVIFDDDSAAVETQRAIGEFVARTGYVHEFKFSRSRDDARDGFFAAVRECAFTVRAIVVEKERVRSPERFAGKEKFFQFFLDALVRRNVDALRDATIVIDGTTSRIFGSKLRATLCRGLPAGALKNVRFEDSRSDALVQLADMCAGAIARAHKPDRTRAGRWLEAIRPRIGEIWKYPRKVRPEP